MTTATMNAQEEQTQRPPVTRALASFASGLRYEHLPPATVEMAKRLLLDGIGCLLAGAQAADGRNATAMVRRLGGAAQATLFTDLELASVRDAAFVNGICLYSVGLNDIHKPAGSHPAGSIIPVVLAVGEWQRVSGTALLAAMAAGYEVIGRVGRATYPSQRERGFHPTGTCGAFGAAAAAGSLLGLDEHMTASAFGIAGSQAAGLYECHHDGTSTMIFHAGRAAQNGVEAALLTQAGFTGPATVLEGDEGFFRATTDRYDAAAAVADLGRRFEIDATSFRPYFGCSSTIVASGATAQILKELKAGSAYDVRDVTVHCNPVPARDNADADPQTLLGARLSLPFNIALVLAKGDVVSTDLDEASLWEPQIRKFLPRVRIVSDAQMARYGARIHVRTNDGMTKERTIREPRGSEALPLLWDDVAEKFCRLVGPFTREASARRVIDAVAAVDRADTMTLVEALRSALGGK